MSKNKGYEIMPYIKKEARKKVQRLQAKQMSASGIKKVSRNVQGQALTYAKKREAESNRDKNTIYSGTWKYPAGLEIMRWQYTREIIKRVEPGPYENAMILELLARQAASVEMHLKREYFSSPDLFMTKKLECVLLATTMDPHVSASSTRLQNNELTWLQKIYSQFYRYIHPKSECLNYVVALFSVGLTEFFYQIAKAVVLSWIPLDERGGDFKAQLDDISDNLESNSYPSILLQGTLENYFFNGWPRYEESKMPPLKYHMPLAILI